MDVRQLTYFVEVANHGSITAASAALDVSQPAISISLRKLEAEVGAPLLERSPSGVTPTAAGAALLPRAKAILARMDEAIEAARTATEAGPRELRIAIPPIVGLQAILDLVENFVPERPDVNLSIFEAGTAGVLEAMEKGEADIGVAFVDEAPNGCKLWTQVDAPIVAYVAPGSSMAHQGLVNLADLDGQPIVLMGAGAHISDLVLDAMLKEGAVAKQIHTTVQLTTLFELAARNAAVGFTTANVSQLSPTAVPLRTNPEMSALTSIFIASHVTLDETVLHVLERITACIEGI